jgi:hypothetical protein
VRMARSQLAKYDAPTHTHLFVQRREGVDEPRNSEWQWVAAPPPRTLCDASSPCLPPALFDSNR